MESTPLQYLGPYRLLRVIRAGQTCSVWEAIQDYGGEKFALKVLNTEHSSNKQYTSELKHEYEVAHKMDHPNVVRVFEFNAERQTPFLVEELSTTRNLKQAIREDFDFVLDNVTSIIDQSAEGLDYFHKQGWVHRDIKPDNFLLTEDMKVKLIDFSIAVRAPRGLTRWLPGKTKVQGTRSYMSPQQIRGELPDIRSDIYSFGCMLFELVAGRPPFSAVNPDDLLNKHLKSPAPSLLANNDEVTTRFAELTSQLLEKNPDDRPQSLSEFLKDFRKLRVLRVRSNQQPKKDADEPE